MPFSLSVFGVRKLYSIKSNAVLVSTKAFELTRVASVAKAELIGAQFNLTLGGLAEANMGTWDESIYGNDTACDWAYELEEANDLTLINETLDKVLAVGAEYLEADLASEGLAACEVVARLKGNWGERNSYTEAVDKWAELHASLADSAPSDKAIAVINRVLEDSSELKELWEEDGENQEWRSVLSNLRTRITT